MGVAKNTENKNKMDSSPQPKADSSHSEPPRVVSNWGYKGPVPNFPGTIPANGLPTFKSKKAGKAPVPARSAAGRRRKSPVRSRLPPPPPQPTRARLAEKYRAKKSAPMGVAPSVISRGDVLTVARPQPTPASFASQVGLVCSTKKVMRTIGPYQVMKHQVQYSAMPKRLSNRKVIRSIMLNSLLGSIDSVGNVVSVASRFNRKAIGKHWGPRVDLTCPGKVRRIQEIRRGIFEARGWSHPKPHKLLAPARRSCMLRGPTRRGLGPTAKAMLMSEAPGSNYPALHIPEEGNLEGDLRGELVHAERAPTISKSEAIKLLLELEIQEEEDDLVAVAYLSHLLLPDVFRNPGYPDDANALPSGKPVVRTEMILPFVGGSCKVIIQRNPINHIILADQGVGNFIGPEVRRSGNSNTWEINGETVTSNQAGFNALNVTTTMKVEYGYSLSDQVGFVSDTSGQRADLRYTTETATGKEIRYIPAAAADTVGIRGASNNVTVGEFETIATWVVDTAGVITLVPSTSAATTAVNGYFIAFCTAPANTVGLYEYAIHNLGLGGEYVGFDDLMMATLYTANNGNAYYAAGAQDGSDYQFIADEASEARVVGCRVTATPFCAWDGEGLITGGQYPQLDSDETPELTLENLAVIPGLEPRRMNDYYPGMSFPILPLGVNTSAYMQVDEMATKEDDPYGVLVIDPNDSKAQFCLLQTELSLQYRSRRQCIEQTPGRVSDKALTMVFNYLAGKLQGDAASLVTDNDDHEAQCVKDINEFSFLNGAFSGNSFTLW